ncbi:DUF418 domain-containing protein [Asticcacaulis sp.]|uniref:DUF418 domain-containing protein n=1 Tax=Asticcacaulis sp. TaxID=1872648 RepID=UPI0031D7AA08
MAGFSTPNRTRYTLIDMYRGLAIFGLLMVHMVERFGVWSSVREPGQISSLVHLAFAGKAYATLALCFGINFSLLVASAKRKGMSPLEDQIWRYSLLFAFGVANTLLFGGDVLQVIAVLAGILIVLSRIKDDNKLLLVGLVCMAQPLIILSCVIGAFAPDFTRMYLIPESTILQPLKLATQEVYRHGSFWDVMATNLSSGNILKWTYQITSGRVFKSLGLFILGVYLGRTGFLQDPVQYLKDRKWAVAIMLALLPITTVTKTIFSKLTSDDLSAYMVMIKTLSSSYFSLFALGAVLVLITWAYTRLPGKLFTPLEKAGQMTLTLYIMQSVVFVPVFYGFGLGGYAFITSGQAVVIGLVFFAAQVIFANIWLNHFDYGPLEWLWRKAIHQRKKLGSFRATRPTERLIK